MKELQKSAFSSAFVRLYRVRRLRGIIVRLVRGLEGGDFYSATLREILSRYHGVSAGAYSYGEGLIPGAFPAGVTIGRYVSIAEGVRIYRRNHPTGRLSTHPFFFNSRLGWVAEDNVAFLPLTIEHDAWIGARAVVTAGCTRIGVGAVVGSGAVVTRDVPDFAVVAGVPAKVLRFRFPEDVRKAVLRQRWWEHSVVELSHRFPEMTNPL